MNQAKQRINKLRLTLSNTNFLLNKSFATCEENEYDVIQIVTTHMSNKKDKIYTSRMNGITQGMFCSSSHFTRGVNINEVALYIRAVYRSRVTFDLR